MKRPKERVGLNGTGVIEEAHYWGMWHTYRVLATCADGVLRTATITGEATTAWTIPAKVSVRGKTVQGHLTLTGDTSCEEPWQHEWLFVVWKAKDHGAVYRNGHLLPEWADVPPREGLDIVDYKLVNYGQDGHQYFPGASVHGTSWTHVYVGQGQSASEAYENVLELAGEVFKLSCFPPGPHPGYTKRNKIPDRDYFAEGAELDWYVILYIRALPGHEQ